MRIPGHFIALLGTELQQMDRAGLYIGRTQKRPYTLACGSAGKESARNSGDPGLIAGLGRSPGEGIRYPLQYSWASLVAQMVKNPPAMRKTWVQSLGWEDPLEEAMTTHSRFLPGESPWTEEPGGLQSMGLQSQK